LALYFGSSGLSVTISPALFNLVVGFAYFLYDFAILNSFSLKKLQSFKKNYKVEGKNYKVWSKNYKVEKRN
jgi:hypothetical protein